VYQQTTAITPAAATTTVQWSTVDAKSQNCLACLDSYTPEVYDSTVSLSGTFCKYQQTACNIAACQSYEVKTKYEFLQCFTCSSLYNSNRYALNSDSQFCDLTTPKNETIPAYTPLYNGVDEGIYGKYDPNYRPGSNNASVLSFALFSVLVALLALLA